MCLLTLSSVLRAHQNGVTVSRRTSSALRSASSAVGSGGRVRLWCMAAFASARLRCYTSRPARSPIVCRLQSYAPVDSLTQLRGIIDVLLNLGVGNGPQVALGKGVGELGGPPLAVGLRGVEDNDL